MLDELSLIKSWDHRKMTTLYNCLAFVFRCKVENDEINQELFEPTQDEIKNFFQVKYVDTLFLDYSDPEYWYLAKKWFEFAMKIVEENKLIVKHIGEAVLLLTQPEYERQQSWDASYKAGDVVKKKFEELPWENYRIIT